MSWKYVQTDDRFFRLPLLEGPTDVGMWHGGSLWSRLSCNGVLHIKKGYAHDGATGVPDFKGTEDGSLVHDVLYQWLGCLERSRRVTRAAADRVFYELMCHGKALPPVALSYWLGVRAFGRAAYVMAQKNNKYNDRLHTHEHRPGYYADLLDMLPVLRLIR